MRCRDEWDLLRRHYRYVAVFACVEQARKDERTDASTKIAGFRFNAGLSAGLAGGTGIERLTPRTHARSAARHCSCLRSRSSNSLWDMIIMPR
jgi:hypothetical protein